MRSLRRAAVILGLLAIPAQILLEQMPAGLARASLTDGVAVLLAVAVGGACLTVALPSPAERRTWRLTGLACLAWGIGTAVSTVLTVGFADARRPSPADLFYLAAVVLAGWALASFPTLPRRTSRRVTVFLDGALTATALLLGTWPWLLGPAVASNAPPGSILLGLGYPLADVLLVTVVLQAASRLPVGRAVSLWLAAAGVGVLAATGVLGFAVRAHATVAAETLVNLGPLVCFALVAAGALRAMQTAQPVGQPPRAAGAFAGPAAPDTRARGPGTEARGGPPVPFAYVAALAALGVWAATSLGNHGADAILALVLTLIIVRQGFLLADNARLDRAIESSERYFRGLVQGSSDLTLLLDKGFQVCYASPSVLDLVGDVAPGSSFLDLLHPQDRGMVSAAVLRVAARDGTDKVMDWRSATLRSAAGGSTAVDEVRARPIGKPGVTFRVHARAGQRWIEAHLAWLDEGPGLHGVVVNGRDVTAAREAEAALMASERAYRRIVETAEEGIWVSTAAGVTEFVNARAAQMLGLEVADILGRPVREVLSPLLDEESRAGVEQRLARRAGGVTERYSFRIRRSDGSYIDTWVSATPLVGDDGRYEGSLSMISDITEQKQLEARLAERAFRDSLTGLANRVAFLERAEEALASVRSGRGLIAVLFCDLDGFKAVNDSLGHPVGDQLLTAVAHRLMTRLRGPDLIARFGGDEFAVLAENLRDPQDALSLAQRMIAALTEPFHVASRDIYVSGSVGVALADPGSASAHDVEPLLRNADLAMYEAKSQGRGNFRLFEPLMHAAVLNRLRLEDELRQGLAREEFLLYYQPILTLDSAQLAGVEALVRWRHPQRGVVGPDEFIDVAEDCGLLVELGAWVLRQACADFASLRSIGGAELHVAVNLGASQLRDPDLPSVVRRATAGCDLAPGQLVLEVTEHSLLALSGTREVLHALRELGAGVSLDDFGTGYSSLSHLRDFPVDVLKLDRSYVQGVPERSEVTALAESVVRLGHALGIRTVAEGIEHPRQRAALSQMGCEFGQGHLFAPALPLAGLRAWARSRGEVAVPAQRRQAAACDGAVGRV